MAAKPIPLSRAGAQVQVSFEFFPPKTAEMETSLWEAATRLEPLSPAFVSVTYGAGGSTRERTHALVERMVRETTMRPAAHLTCVGSSCGEIRETLRDYHSAGVRHIVALRGDPPTGFDAPYETVPGGYRSTAELVADATKMGFEVSVGTYPERHPQSPTLLHDVEILKQKVDAGATRAITQFFFDNSAYFRFLDVAAAAGLHVPIVPGIFPVQNFKQTANFARRTGASVPQWLADRFEGLEDDPATPRRGGRLRRAGDRPRRPWRGGAALLHHEPRRSGVRDLPPCGPARHARAGRDSQRAARTAAPCGGSLGISGRAKPLLTTPIAGRQACFSCP
jgi:methylenetetrahydrofolate reductase (NADPH)